MYDIRKILIILGSFAIIILIVAGLYPNQISEDSLLDVWLNEDKNARVTIYKCGKDKKLYCGKISWLKEPNFPTGDKEAGKPRRDRENPDPALQNRKIMGLNMLHSFRWDGEKWADGKIYDPRKGTAYNCYIELVEPNKLKLRGYIGFSLFGRTVYWTRYNNTKNKFID